MDNKFTVRTTPIFTVNFEYWLIFDNDYWFKWSEEDGQTAPPLMFDI